MTPASGNQKFLNCWVHCERLAGPKQPNSCKGNGEYTAGSPNFLCHHSSRKIHRISLESMAAITDKQLGKMGAHQQTMKRDTQNRVWTPNCNYAGTCWQMPQGNILAPLRAKSLFPEKAKIKGQLEFAGIYYYNPQWSAEILSKPPIRWKHVEQRMEKDSGSSRHAATEGKTAPLQPSCTWHLLLYYRWTKYVLYPASLGHF